MYNDVYSRLDCEISSTRTAVTPLYVLVERANVEYRLHISYTGNVALDINVIVYRVYMRVRQITAKQDRPTIKAFRLQQHTSSFVNVYNELSRNRCLHNKLFGF